MRPTPQLVVFDMAGTTIDEDQLVYRTLRDAVTAVGFPVHLRQVLLHAAGMEKRAGIRAVLSGLGCPPDLVHEVTHAAHTVFEERLKTAYATAPLMACAGAVDLFAFLRERKVRVALNTGYDRSTAENLLQRLGWTIGHEVDALVTASDVDHGRPAPDMVLRAMREVNVSEAGRVMKVGDTTVDIEEGQSANCGWAIGITTGAHDRARLLTAHPDAVIDNLAELRAYFAPLATVREP